MAPSTIQIFVHGVQGGVTIINIHKVNISYNFAKNGWDKFRDF